MFNRVYENRRVLVTGDTGFKGSWLTLWLNRLGAKTRGIALAPEGNPNHFALLGMARACYLDIRDDSGIRSLFDEFRPEIVFHLAAQPLVRRSYELPAETFSVNMMGTVALLEQCRRVDSVRAIVVVTSDKCYENREWVWGYRENDPMGGHDPYSASKGCVELIAGSYRRSFFQAENAPLLATARAGNVIGGGDWSADRLVPDIMKAAARGETVVLRHPESSRSWLHVLEPLAGYLRLGQCLYEGNRRFAEAWNFGPGDTAKTVRETAGALRREWPAISFRCDAGADGPHEANLLALDSTKARTRLNWRPVWDYDKTVKATAQWYREFYRDGRVLTETQLEEYWNDGGGAFEETAES